MSKVMVIGAGPAGIMAAITAAENHNVVLVDGNEKIAKKLFIARLYYFIKSILL